MDGVALQRESKAFGLDLTRTQLEAFGLFERKLYEANAVMNLTRVPASECWSRHFLDSLSLSPLIPLNALVLDIGSGGGFPGACLAIARSDLRVVCMDSHQKAFVFLQSLFGSGGLLPVLYRVVLARAELAAHEPEYRERFDFVTGRAVAPLAVQCELSAGFVRVGGEFVPMRTPSDREAARFGSERLGLQLVDLRQVRIGALGADRLFPIYKKVGQTPKDFPRPFAKIKSHPLSKDATNRT